MAFQDFQRVKRLGRYLQKDKRRLLLILFLLLPLSFAGAIQPLLVGQAISVLKGEAAFSWLNALSMEYAIRILITLLLFSFQTLDYPIFIGNNLSLFFRAFFRWET